MKRFIVFAFMACCSASMFAQGMYWQSTTEAADGKHTEESFAMPKMFKIVRTGETRNSSTIIFRLDKQLLWMLNPEEKTYSEMTFADMEKMANKGAERMAAMKERMKEMPEERRKMMEKMMGANDQPVEVKNTGESKTVSGYKCTKFLVLRGGEEMMSLWVTDGLKEFKPLMADWKSFSERMSAMTARFAKGMSDIYAKINGFPMQTTLSVMGQTMTTSVTKVEKRTVPSGEFEVPAGYKKVKSEMENAMEKMDKEN